MADKITSNGVNKINILGLNISTLDRQETLIKIEEFLSDGKQHQIVTPNPEFLVEAGHNEEFFYILNKADLAIPDGTGLVIASRILGQKIERITGVDMISDICAMAERTGKSVFFLGGEEGTAEASAVELKKRFPNLKIAGAEEGLKAGTWELKAGKWLKGASDNAELIARINIAHPDIILVAYGHPRQDKWIFHNLAHLPSVRLAMGIGGGFDFISGRIKRAPRIFRSLSIEWLWRLIIEPWRAKRIFMAVVVFPLKFLKWKFVMPFIYRKNVVCFLYKHEGGRFKVFLVKRTHEPDHWQLPQGGTDGQSIAKAGERELREETGNTKFIIKKTISNVYKYQFGKGERLYETKKHIGFKGQKQSLCIALFVGNDEHIKINFWDHDGWKWADSENLPDEVFYYRKEATMIFLREFKKHIQSTKKLTN